MNIKFSLSDKVFSNIRQWFIRTPWLSLVLLPALFSSVLATFYAFSTDTIVAYGDAESHLNIAKRVVSSLTPGAAQLGGIWLPLPHIMMVPFVSIDFLWRSGLAGSIVSGFCFIIASIYLYKLTYLITKSKIGSLAASYLFIANPNILYLQSTAMTELPLLAFFLLSSYYFIKFLRAENEAMSSILAAFFGFCAVLSRYDGWFLVVAEVGIIGLIGLFRKWQWKKIEGYGVLFGTLAFFGIALWLLWGQVILGNAFYFTQSEFSAKTQQAAWLAKGELPAYHNLPLAFLYYAVTAMSNAGLLIFILGVFGFMFYLSHRSERIRFLVALLLLVPLFFNVLTLFLGQSVIFIPHLTPVSYEWRLFNVRYGVMLVPVVAFFVGYLFYKSKWNIRLFLVGLVLLQYGLYAVGYSSVLSYQDGIAGLSHAKRPDAEGWMKTHYDDGLVLLDDYTRTISIVRSGIPMKNIIYIGNKPYWEDSLKQPEKYAKWIVMQKNDDVWKHIYDDPVIQSRLYEYFTKVYTSPEILIFERHAIK
jgi:hypothetical protein